MVKKTKEYLEGQMEDADPAVQAVLKQSQTAEFDPDNDTNPIAISTIRPSSFIKAALPEDVIEAALEGRPPAIDQELAGMVPLLVPSARSILLSLAAQLKEAVASAKNVVQGHLQREQTDDNPLIDHIKTASNFLDMMAKGRKQEKAQFKLQLDEPANKIASQVHNAIEEKLPNIELLNTRSVITKIQNSLRRVS